MDRRLVLHYGDLLDVMSLSRIINEAKPHEVYNLAAQSHVRVSFDQPMYTADVVGLGALRMLEAVRQAEWQIRFYHASSSEMFGAAPPMQSETTLFHPRSPYACAKVFAFEQVRNTERPTGSMRATASCSITNHPVAARHS